MGFVALDHLLEDMGKDLEAINKAHGLLSQEQKGALLRDIEYLFMDNIAEEIRFVFYDPLNRDSVFLQSVYARDTIRKPSTVFDDLKGELPQELVFDIFVVFSKGFLQLESGEQELLLGNTERNWYTYES